MPAASAETIVDVADRLFTAIEKSDIAAVDRTVERRHRGLARRRSPR